MKNAFFVLLLMGASATAPAQSFVLTGNIGGADGIMLHLDYPADGGKWVKDSCQVQHGNFRFSGNIPGPVGSYLSKPGEGTDLRDRKEIRIFLEPATIHVAIRDGAFEKAVVSGSKTQSEYEVLKRKQDKLEQRWKVVMDTLTQANKRSNFEYQALKDWVLVPYDIERKEIDYAFFDSHPTSYVTAYMLDVEGREMTTDSLRILYNRFPEQLKRSSYGKGVLAEIDRRKIGAPGTQSLDFETTDINGNKLALSDFKGHPILLDFWASWCLPCRKSSPHLKELYAAYKDKGLVIIGIASDDDRPDAWRKAVDQDSVGLFHQVLEGFDRQKAMDGKANLADIGKKYGIVSLPTKILIDKDGTIVGRYEDDDPTAMDGRLAGLFDRTAPQKFVLSGTVEGQQEGKVYLTYALAKGKYVQDSAVLHQGTFRFSGMLSQPAMAFFHGKTRSRDMDDPNATSFFIEPGNMQLAVRVNDFKHATLAGSASQDEYTAMENSKEPVEAQYKPQLDSMRKEKDHEKAAAIRERLAPYFAALHQKDYEFFAAHPQSPVTAYMLRFYVGDLSLDSLQLFYDRLGEKCQLSAPGKEIALEIQKLRAGSPGSPAKDFSARDIDGQPLALSAFKGKSYVLIDFWASWCIPCRHSNPHMIELFQRYHDKGFDVIGVSDDDGHPDAWKKAVTADGVGIWHNVLRGLDWDKLRKGEPNENDISEKYGIHSLPTKILIDKEGKIIGRYGEGRDDEDALDKKLADVLLK
jgi:thiol-disulfide isomerase/thioredoxin